MKALVLFFLATLFAYLFMWTCLYAQQRTNQINRSLRVFFVSLAIWSLCEFGLFFIQNDAIALVGKRLSASCWVLSGLLYANFIYKIRDKRINYWIWGIGGLVILYAVIFLVTDWGISSVHPADWGYDIEPGPLYLPLGVVAGLVWISNIIWLRVSYGEATEPVAKKSIHLISVGTVITVVVTMVLWGWVARVSGFSYWMTVSVNAGVALVPFVLAVMFRYNFMVVDMEQIAQDLFKDSHDAIILIDQNNYIRRINPTAKRWFGLRSSTVELPSIYTVFPSYDEVKGLSEFEYRMPDSQLSFRYLQVFQSTTTRQGRVIGKLVVIRDVTDEKAAEEVLKRTHEELEVEIANRIKELAELQELEAIGTLSGSIAHDFNNLLAAIIGFSTAAYADLPDDEPTKKDVAEIMDAAKKARGIVNQLLAFSRPQKTKRKVIELGGFIRDTLPLIEASVPASIQLECALPEHKVYIMGNETDLHQAMMNLCTNAYQSMSASGGTLRISLASLEANRMYDTSHGTLETNKTVRLTISDTGCGMSQEVLKSAFEPFYTTKSDTPGLGLATVARIVKEHAGTVVANSVENEGAEFSILLPELETNAPEEQFNDQVLIGGEHVLFVDNDEQLVRLGKRLLTSLGYRISAFTSAADALDAFRKSPGAFDLVLTDFKMPVMNGLGLTEKILDERRDIPVLLISGNITEQELEQAKRLGVRGFIRKPFNRDEIAAKLRRMLDGQADRISYPAPTP